MKSSSAQVRLSNRDINLSVFCIMIAYNDKKKILPKGITYYRIKADSEKETET